MYIIFIFSTESPSSSSPPLQYIFIKFLYIPSSRSKPNSDKYMENIQHLVNYCGIFLFYKVFEHLKMTLTIHIAPDSQNKSQKSIFHIKEEQK